MNKKFFSSLFHKSSIKQEEKNLILDKIYSLRDHTNLIIYDSVDIFHHKRSYSIPLILYDEYRGLYLFEIKKWSYDDLKDATLTQSNKTEHAEDTLSFNTMHEGITKKLDEIIHTSDIPIHNYLIMTHLSSHQYQNLDKSLKNVLFEEKIIFNNLDASQILQKLHNEKESSHSYGSTEKIMGTLLTQYTLLDKKNELFLANQQQKEFIDKELKGFTTIHSSPKSGMSSTLLLKAIFEILKNPSLKVVIIKPTKLAKDILHRQLLEIIEHAIVEFDILSVDILTPLELENKTVKKELSAADIVLCDDANLMDREFISSLKASRQRDTLVVCNSLDDEASLSFSESYLQKRKNTLFYKTNPHAKALQLTAQLLKQNRAEEILLVSDNVNREKLKDDLKFFIEDEAKLLDSNISLAFQELDTLKLASYKDLNEVLYKSVLLLDVENASIDEVEYAINHAEESVHILYEEDSQTIQQLKEKYENNQK